MSAEGRIRDFDLSVGDLSELLGLTPRAIRFYEEAGLVQSRRDRFNWRRYGGEARRRLALVAALRSADVPIEEIRIVMQTAGDCADAQRRAVILSLERRLASLEAERNRLLGQLEAIRSTPAPAPSIGRSKPSVQGAAGLRETK